MIKIEFKNKIDESIYKLINEEFDKYSVKNNVICNFKPFVFVAKDGEKIVGLLTGNSYYKEIHISELIVLEEYRKKHIGTELLKSVENNFKGKGFSNINLSTYNFQAPEFYKKCGFKVEFVRENLDNPKLNKYYLVKYF